MSCSCHSGGKVWRVAFWFGLRAWRDGRFDRDAARERETQALDELARRLSGKDVPAT
jgi:hypothetical protein